MYKYYKLVSVLTFFLLACSLPERADDSVMSDKSVRTMLMSIQHVPSRYTDTLPFEGKKEESKDSVFNRLIKMDTAAIEPLIGVLADTSLTKIANPCGKSYFRVGQLAMLIIHQIEFIPFMTVTGIQFDSFDCGAFPEGWLEYVQEHGAEFQRQYRTYFRSEQRQQDLRKYPKSAN